MKPHTLKEFAENLRIKGDWREIKFADEILTLVDIEKEVERLGNRHHLLSDIEKELKDAGREPQGRSNTVDAIKEIIGTLGEAEDILEAAGWPDDWDFIAGIQALADRPKPMEYDL